MVLELKTETLKVATSKAAKGTGNLSMLAITSAIGIEVVGNDLVLTTTDNNTNVEVFVKNVVKEPVKFYACTNSDLFCKLISKQNCEKIKLDLQPNMLQVVGDGVYNLPLIQDEEGGMGRITPIEVEGLEPVVVQSSELKKMLKYNKLAVSKYFDTPIYTGYCVNNEKVYTYNGVIACVTAVNLKTINMLIPFRLAELLELFEDKNVSVSYASNRVKFSSEDVVITGAVLEGFESYPAQQLGDLVYSDTFNDEAKVNRQKLLNILDRLSLFVSDKEQNAIQLNFADSGLLVSNVGSSACEKAPYTNQKEQRTITSAFIDLRDLKVIVNAVDDEQVTFLYSDGSPICVCTDNMRFIIPLLEDESDEEQEEETIEEDEDLN